jgi:hypothetical protein
MKRGENMSCANQLSANVRSGGNQRGQLPVAGQSPHDDLRVAEPAVWLADLIDPEIHTGGEPAIERDLLTARREPQLGSREVDEWKPHRFHP